MEEKISLRAARRKDQSIPLLPYLDKFVRKHFFERQDPPFKIEDDSLLDQQIMALILDKRKIYFSGSKGRMTTLPVSLSDKVPQKLITKEKLLLLNNYLALHFKQTLITWIESAEYCGVRPITSSKDYLNYYGITETEYTHGAAYKVWLRFKKRGHEIKKSPVSNV